MCSAFNEPPPPNHYHSFIHSSITYHLHQRHSSLHHYHLPLNGSGAQRSAPLSAVKPAMRRPPDSASSASALTPFSSVEECVHQSTELWARDLRSLFEHAVDRFADVSWETDSGDRIWAHKGRSSVRFSLTFSCSLRASTKWVGQSMKLTL